MLAQEYLPRNLPLSAQCVLVEHEDKRGLVDCATGSYAQFSSENSC